MPTDKEFAAFKDCLATEIQAHLEDWDSKLFQPLQDLHTWWMRQSETTRRFTKFVVKKAGQPLVRWLGKTLALDTTELALAFGAALAALAVNVALTEFMEAVGHCLVDVA